jgi:hypothetical protein
VFNNERNEIFVGSGRIEIFLFMNDHLTKMISANRVSGTLKNKVLNCDKRGYKMVAINHILSTIKNVLPREYVEKKIFI